MERYETPYMHGIYREQLDIIDIVQSRVNGINDQCVVDYACAMDRDENLPMIQVLQSELDNDRFILIDGFHRVKAMDYRNRLLKDDYLIPAEVVGVGGLEDAVFLGAAANKTNGLQRTNDDKRNAIKKVIESEIGKKMSDRAIAEHVGVSDKTVGKVRKELLSGAEIRTCEHPKDQTRVGRDGKEYKVSKEKITESLPLINLSEESSEKNAELLLVNPVGVCYNNGTSDNVVYEDATSDNIEDKEELFSKEEHAAELNKKNEDESLLKLFEKHWRIIERSLNDAKCSLSFDEKDHAFYLSSNDKEIGRVEISIHI